MSTGGHKHGGTAPREEHRRPAEGSRPPRSSRSSRRPAPPSLSNHGVDADGFGRLSDRAGRLGTSDSSANAGKLDLQPTPAHAERRSRLQAARGKLCKDGFDLVFGRQLGVGCAVRLVTAPRTTTASMNGRGFVAAWTKGGKNDRLQSA